MTYKRDAVAERRSQKQTAQHLQRECNCHDHSKIVLLVIQKIHLSWRQRVNCYAGIHKICVKQLQ